MSNTHDNQAFAEANFDQQARGLHAAAMANLSPQTLARLRSARHAATQPRRSGRWRWMAATAFSAVLAAGVGLQFLPQREPPAGATRPLFAATTSGSDYSAALEENPDLYVWLASTDSQLLASE